MSVLLVNGKSAIEATIVMPLTGAWWAEVALDDRDPPNAGDAVSLEAEGQTWKGSVFRAGQARGTTLLRVVGGAGGLRKVLPPKFYTSTALRTPLQDALREAGERLASSTSSADTSTEPPFWTRLEGSTAEALRQLAQHAGANWRVLADGTVWFGKEKWRAVSMDVEALDEDPQAGRLVMWMEKPTLVPGVSLNGKHVAKVEHRIGERIRTNVWFDDASDPDDLATALESIVRSETSHVDYHAPYAAKVLSQNADGTLELELDDPRLPGMSKVPVRYGLAAGKTKLKAGGRGIVLFENGSPACPCLGFWESADVDTTSFTADNIKLGSDTADKALALAEKVNSELSSIMNYLSGTLASHTHPVTGSATGPSANLSPTPSHTDVGSTVVKAKG